MTNSHNIFFPFQYFLKIITIMIIMKCNLKSQVKVSQNERNVAQSNAAMKAQSKQWKLKWIVATYIYST